MRRNQDFMPMQRGRQTDLAPRGGGWMAPEMFFNASPWQMMRRMQEDMDRVFGQFFADPAGGGGSQGGQQGNLTLWTPRMDVSETDREWTVEVELPGVREEDIDLSLHDNLLNIRAEMRQEEELPAPGQTQTEAG